MDSNGKAIGIKRIMLAGAVAYERESLVDWLEARSSILPPGEKWDSKNKAMVKC